MDDVQKIASYLSEVQGQVRRSLTRNSDESALKDTLLTIYGLTGHALRMTNALNEEPKPYVPPQTVPTVQVGSSDLRYQELYDATAAEAVKRAKPCDMGWALELIRMLRLQGYRIVKGAEPLVGGKINAIKVVRSSITILGSPLGLKDAKDIIDALDQAGYLLVRR